MSGQVCWSDNNTGFIRGARFESRFEYYVTVLFRGCCHCVLADVGTVSEIRKYFLQVVYNPVTSPQFSVADSSLSLRHPQIHKYLTLWRWQLQAGTAEVNFAWSVNMVHMYGVDSGFFVLALVLSGRAEWTPAPYCGTVPCAACPG